MKTNAQLALAYRVLQRYTGKYPVFKHAILIDTYELYTNGGSAMRELTLPYVTANEIKEEILHQNEHGYVPGR